MAALFMLLGTAACRAEPPADESGSASAESAAPAAEAGPEALTSYTISSAGITLGIPAGWRVVADGHPLSKADLDSVRKLEPELLPAIEAAAKPDSPVELFAFGSENAPADFGSTALVVAEPLPSGVSADDYFAAREQNVRDLMAAVPETTEMTLPAGRALRLAYRHTTSHLTREIAQIDYAIVADGTAYVLTYSALPDEIESLQPVFEASAQSFRASR